MAAFSETSIANRALLELGQETIGSLNDRDPNAVKIKGIYALTNRELQSQDWFFTRTRMEITRLEAEPAFGTWKVQYVLPADLHNIIALSDQFNDFVKYRYVREGDKLFTNRTEGFLRYNQLIEDVSRMPPWYTDLFGLTLARRLSPQVNKDEAVIARIDRALIDAWDEARSGNAQDAYFEDAHGDTDGNVDVTFGLRDDIL